VHAAYADAIQAEGYPYPTFRCGRGTGFSFLEEPQLVVGNKTGLQPGMVFAVDGGSSTKDFRGQVGDSFIITKDGYEKEKGQSIKATALIRAYRIRGHLMASLDPLGMMERKYLNELDPSNHGFKKEDYNKKIYLREYMDRKYSTINEILAFLRKTYCSTIGTEFMHISDPIEKKWFRERMEKKENQLNFTTTGKKFILNKLIQAEGFEKFLAVKFVGTKRFGIDGGEALIPALEQIIKRGGQLGVKEIKIGMPHRGRLNVLANLLQKSYKRIFNEFAGEFGSSAVESAGDVKYHLGASSNREFDGNLVHISLSDNPSHLEAVDPVVLGQTRAKQFFHKDIKRQKVIPVLIHGDAAFAGQGVVAECFAMSGVRGHSTGGTIHIIVNNQIGFTTNPRFARSSPYPSDIAKMVEAPILHCNGDDPEAVVHCARMAIEFRQQFNRDVVIDMICYRRFGHNEGDEPSFTQPKMYQKITDEGLDSNSIIIIMADHGMGVGEKVEQLDVFHPDRIANRILGMGDVVSLVEKAAQDLDEEKIKKTEENLKSGSFSMEDYLSQLRQMKKMGGMEGVLSMLPGVSKIKKQMDNFCW